VSRAGRSTPAVTTSPLCGKVAEISTRNESLAPAASRGKPLRQAT
jgi:hypothetical protein